MFLQLLPAKHSFFRQFWNFLILENFFIGWMVFLLKQFGSHYFFNRCQKYNFYSKNYWSYENVFRSWKLQNSPKNLFYAVKKLQNVLILFGTFFFFFKCVKTVRHWKNQFPPSSCVWFIDVWVSIHQNLGVSGKNSKWDYRS